MSESEKKKSVAKQWWFWVIIVLSILLVASVITNIVLLSKGDEKDTKKSSDYKGSNSVATATVTSKEKEEDTKETKNTKNDKAKKTNPTLGDTIEFDDFELTFGTEIEFVKVDNTYADENGKDVIKLPVTIKNVGEETKSFNDFYCDYFGTKGTQLSKVDYYFEESVGDSDKLRPGAVIEANFFLLYDGDGTYGIDFDDYTTHITFEFNVEKP